MFEDIRLEEDNVFSRTWRQQTRVTAAITISHLDAWKDGLCVPGLKEFLDKTCGEAYDISTTKNYCKFLLENVWDKSSQRRKIDPVHLGAASSALSASTLDWVGIPYDLQLGVLNNNALLTKTHHVRFIWEEMIELTSNSTESSRSYSLPSCQMSVQFFEDVCVFTSWDNKVCMMPWLCVIAFKESMAGIMDALIYQTISDLLNPRGITHLLMEMIEAAITSMKILGESCYDVLKALHPMAVGNVLDNEKIGLVNTLRSALVEELPKCPLLDMFARNWPSREEQHTLLSLAGLSKSFTYPVCNIDGAVNNVVSKATVFNADKTAGNNALYMFRKTFCRTYVREEKKWPPVKLVGPVRGDIQEAIKRGLWSDSSEDWHPDDFSNIEIQQCLQFNWRPDSTDVLDDKAISVPLSSWPREYDYRYHKLKYGRGCNPGPPCERRLVMHHIKQAEIVIADDVISYVNGSDRNDQIFVMCLKERELSRNKGRFFTKQTPRSRSYQTTLELNIKKILRFVPQTSMNLSGDALTKYLLSRSSEKSSTKTSIDFSKWCQYQRAGLVDPIAEQIDSIFGVSPLYASVHLVPQRSWWLFKDQANIPQQGPSGEPVQGPRSFPGLMTQGEGMFQRLWTIVTGCGIMYHMYPTRLKCELMGSGDNQLLIADIPPTLGASRVQQLILDGLDSFSKSANLPIKIEETYLSCSYMEYGKTSFIDGKKVCAGLKKSTRIGSESQESIPSINTKISGIFATGIACAYESIIPVPAYITSLLEFCLTLEVRGFKSSQSRLSLMCLLSRQLGGFKVSLYPSFCIRGNNDIATMNIQILTSLYKNRDKYPRIWSSFLTAPLKIGKMDWSQVAKDPYSLPLIRPEDADAGTRELVEEILPQVTENREILALLSKGAEDEEKKLIETLKDLYPMSLKLIAAIYEMSNVAIKERAITRFTSSATLSKLASGFKTQVEMTQGARARDSILMSHYNDRCNHRSKNDFVSVIINDPDCATAKMDLLRMKIAGIHLENPSAPPPQHQSKIMRWDDLTQQESSYAVQVEVDPNIGTCRSLRGDRPCYIGSNTRVKRTKSPLDVINPASQDRTVLDIGELMNWIGCDPNLQQFLESLIREKTITNPDVIKMATDRVMGGSFEHRGRVMTLSPGCHVNFDPVIMSYLQINSDTALEFARKGGDYTIMFQGVKISTASRLAHLMVSGVDITGTWAAVLSCMSCSRRVYEGEFSLSSSPSYRGFSLGSETRIQFIPSGRTYGQADEGSSNALVGAHVHMAEAMVSTMSNYERLELTMETDRVEPSDSAVTNPQMSLSDVARCDIKLLMQCVLQRLEMRPDLKTLLAGIALEGSSLRVNPVRAVIDPILGGGRGQDLNSLLGVFGSYELSTDGSKAMAFGYLMRTMTSEAIRNSKFIMSDDSDESVLLLLDSIAEERASAESPRDMFNARRNAATIDDLCAVYGLTVVPSPSVCQKTIRSQLMYPNTSRLCKLDNKLVGNVPCSQNPPLLTNASVSYGLTVFASQVWSILPLLPTLPILVLEDFKGSIGIVAGHGKSGPAYIHEKCLLKQRRKRYSGGPFSLMLDSCSVSYHRDYYVRNLSSEVPQRPPVKGNILVISVKNPRESHPTVLRDGDVILSRSSNVGGALIGFPRRGARDLWYSNHINSGEPETRNVTEMSCLSSFVTSCEGPRLAPETRLRDLLGLEGPITAKKIVSSAAEHIVNLVRYNRRVFLALIRSKSHTLKSSKPIPLYGFRSMEDNLFYSWIMERASGRKDFRMRWHISSLSGSVHFMLDHCSCLNYEEKTYTPNDELLAYYLTGRYLDYNVGDDPSLQDIACVISSRIKSVIQRVDDI